MVRKFYGDILPEAGYYCLTLLPQGEHVWAETLDQLSDLTEQYIERSGLYFGTASFQSFANRKQSNVLALKALRLDIDAGPAKLAKHGPGAVYATQKEALAASIEFFKASGLTPTYVVSSGAGLHLYYCLTEAIEPGEWLLLAKGLSAAGNRLGLKIDPSVTEDSARILRVPGALHPNGKRVAVLRDLGVFHDAAVLREKLGVLAPVRRATGINDELDLSFQGPPSSALKVAQHCAALREVAESGGDVPEPFWRAMIGLVKRTVEGEDIAHQWSQGYEGYDAYEVDRKFQAWATGPTTCSEFAKHTSACASCPHQGKIKSPINLGLMTTPEIQELPEAAQEILQAPTAQAATGDPWDGAIPAGFSVERFKNGKLALVQTVQGEKESPTGEMVPVMLTIPFTYNVFWFGQWAEAEGSDDNAQAVVHLWTGTHTKTYEMDQSLVASPFKLLEYLSGKAIHTTTHKKASQAMQDYAKAQLQHIYATRKNLKVTDRMGLRILDDGELICTQGRYTIFSDGTVRDTMMGAQLRSLAGAFTVPLPPGAEQWGPEVWDGHVKPLAQRHVEFARKYYGQEGRERFQLAIMMSLASPFMAFVTGEYVGGPSLPNNSSLTVSLYSHETARGKTTAAQVAILAYGRPSALSSDSGKAGATINGRLGVLSMHGTLPSIMDEMSDVTAVEAATTVSSVANGAGKTTMTSSRALRQESTWSLVNIITTNVSQRDMVMAARSAAGPVLYRLLEIDVDNMPEYSMQERADFRDDWSELNRDCTGALGAMVHREICAMGVATVLKLVTQCVAKAEKFVNATQSARFQSRGLGAMLALDVVLRRLGLHIFDIQALARTFKEAHDANLDYVIENAAPADPLAVLSQCLLDLAPHTLVTENEGATANNVMRFDRVLNARTPDVVLARHIRSLGISYVSVDAVKAWFREKSLPERPSILAARRAGILQTLTRTVGDKTVERSYGDKSLTRGLEGDMRLNLRAYTLDIRRLNQALGLKGGMPLEVVTGGAPPQVAPETAAA